MGRGHRTAAGHVDRPHRARTLRGFSPDGRTLATGSSDGTARLWNLTLVDPKQAVDKICAAVHRDLTPLERTTYLGGRRDSACPN